MKPSSSNDHSQHILIVEPDANVAASIEMILGEQGEGHNLTHCEDGAEALELATSGENGNSFDLILANYRLTGIGGLELLERLREQEPQRPIILMSANANTNLVIEATKRGAYDYLVRPFDAQQLIAATAQALRASKAMRKTVRLGSSQAAADEEPQLLGSCPEMQKVYKEIGRFAPTDATVLVLGETGTGKELVARALYQHSKRSEKSFVAVNCGAIPENLLESELFGHVRGAFTGATSNRVGRFQQADGGTLFLDEVGDLPLPVQVKLLRVLQEGTFQPLGSTKDIQVDVRVIAATHQPLSKLIAEQSFREDLFYRLNSAIIELPPLRERGKDLETLIHHFVEVSANRFQVTAPEIPKAALKRLHSHPWPGNARELSNVMGQIAVRSQGYPVSVELVEKALAGIQSDTPPRANSNNESQFALAILNPLRKALEEARENGSGDVHQELVSELEKQLITNALELSSGHLGHVSSWLGISRVTLRKKIEVYGLKSQ